MMRMVMMVMRMVMMVVMMMLMIEESPLFLSSWLIFYEIFKKLSGLRSNRQGSYSYNQVYLMSKQLCHSFLHLLVNFRTPSMGLCIKKRMTYKQGRIHDSFSHVRVGRGIEVVRQFLGKNFNSMTDIHFQCHHYANRHSKKIVKF